MKLWILGSVALLTLATSAVAGPYHYTARAEGILAKDASGHVLEFASVGPLPGYKDSEETATLPSVVVSGVLRASGLKAHAETNAGKVRSVATATKVSLGLTQFVSFLTADSIKSVSTDNAGRDASGYSEFVNLQINGQPFVPSGQVNETVKINVAGIGKVALVFNAESVGDDGRMNHTALRITLPLDIQLYVCRTSAGSVLKHPNP